MKALLTTLGCLAFLWASAQNGEAFLRHPALSSDGSTIAFSYQGDIWTADADGGMARRLTIHESYEADPKWSPDGSHILFTGERYGNSDLYTIPAGGGQVERLTHFSGGDSDGRWVDDEQIVFSTSRMYRAVERLREFYTISADGGTPERLNDILGNAPTISPDGRYLAFERGNCRVAREAYRGPANRDIWIYDMQEDDYTQITDFDGQDIIPTWDDDNNLYFLSAREGRYNLYRVAIEDGEAQGDFTQLTDFSDMGIRYYDVARNGSKVVVERGTSLYSMPADGSGRPQELSFDVTSDYRFYPVEKEQFTSNLSEYAVSPDGEHIAFGIRGELFVMPADKDKSRAKQVTNHSWRDEDVTWLNDSTLLFVSDRQGNRNIYMVQSEDADEPSLYRTFKTKVTQLTDTEIGESNLVLSPKHDKIAFMRGRGTLVVADISEEGLSNEIIMQDGWAGPSGVTWSPDGQWLAYSMQDLDFNAEVYIHKADNSEEPVNVSMHPRGDYSPVWSADGRKLAFVSNRNYGDNDVWFVWLRKADWEKTQRDWEEDEDEDEKKNGEDDEMVVTIDFENIHRRLEQVTALPGNESNLLISKDGETFYFSAYGGGRSSASGEPAFMSIKWDGSEMKTILSGRRIYGLSWDKDHKQIYHVARGRLAKLNPGNKKTENLPFQARMKIDHQAVREQVFDDAWRALDAGFYDPQFHGRDWQELRDTYRPMALAASTSQDFRTVFNEMLGQVNASHMGLYGPDPEETQRDRTGMLGVEVHPVSNGVEVTRVIPNSPADRTDSKLMVDDVITAVNGTPVDAATNFYSLFEGEANERVLLDVTGGDGAEREVVIRPTTSLRGELYEEWVEKRRQLTEEYSGGRLGYIHIQGMNWPSFERFERELTASGLGKDGIVIDVRYNGGGWTTDMLMTVLNVRQHAYTVPRGAAADLDKENQKFRDHYPFGERLPLSAWTKPSVALCNETSYSNAEIFSHAYKTLGHGTLVGVPTFGAVISTGGYGLMDGSYVRMPFRAWYVKATGENMEHGPAVPDVIVDYPPAAKGSGDDPQLKKAVEVLLEQLDE